MPENTDSKLLTEQRLQRIIELLEEIVAQQKTLELLGAIARKLGVKFVDG